MQCDCQQTWCSECLWRVAIPRDAAIPPAVREAAVRLREWQGNSDSGDYNYRGMSEDILLLCQHVLGREQG